MKKIVSFKVVCALNNLFETLTNLTRWTEFLNKNKYDELTKQAFNCITTFFLTKELERAGCSVDYKNIPKIALIRSIQKANINGDTHEGIFEEMFSISGLDSAKKLKKATESETRKRLGDEFTQFLFEANGSTEEILYKAATKIATLIEFEECSNFVNDEKFVNKKKAEIEKSIEKYKQIPGFNELFNSKTMDFLRELSRLRNQTRWLHYSRSKDCSVLGHLFDTAIFAYLIGLETFDETKAVEMFWIGIFHDIPEMFTKDIPAPLKDKIKGLRKLSEEYENKVMEKYVYSEIPEYLVPELKKVMLETEENEEIKPYIKGADYMSAVTEIYRNLQGGSRDYTFINALTGHKVKFKNGTARITKNMMRFYNKLVRYSKKLGIREL